MEKYVPDLYQKSIYTIDYNKLKNRGIKCLLFDLDNTMVPIKMKTPSNKLKELFDSLKHKGFKIIIFSNSQKSRLKPFKDGLGVDCSASSKKPSIKKFNQVLSIYGYDVSEVAIIGDEILTDILGGNKIGITTVLVNPVGKKDFFAASIRRKMEKIIMKKLRDRDLFSKGRYYE